MCQFMLSSLHPCPEHYKPSEAADMLLRQSTGCMPCLILCPCAGCTWCARSWARTTAQLSRTCIPAWRTGSANASSTVDCDST